MAYFEHIDDEFDFGKFKGFSLSDVMDINPDYIIWCMLNINSKICEFVITDNAMSELKSVYPHFMISNEFDEMRIKRLYYDDTYYDTEGGSYWHEEETYERYNGSYAQDVMGYSDDDIDTIFDGDPDAYWNID